MARAKNKTVANDGDVDNFIASIRDNQRRADAILINEMMHRLTDEIPIMWGGSIVGFGSYHYKYKSGREGDFLKVGFSPRKQSLTIYIMPGFDRYEDLLSRLGKHKLGKSCLYIKKVEDVDQEILESLIIESYAYMTQKYG